METARVLSSAASLPVTHQIARRAGEMKSTLARSGRTLAIADMIVAATALEFGLVLVTKNRKDFPIEQLMFWQL